MILISASRAILDSYKIQPATTTPAIPTSDWFRMWRVDCRPVKEKALTFFTNAETLYTVVIDSSHIRSFEELIERFMHRYGALFRGQYGSPMLIDEEIVVHKALDRSVAGAMNHFFKMAEDHERVGGRQGLESWINDIPIIARNLIPAVSLALRLNAKPDGTRL